MSSVLITGGTGFFGKSMLDYRRRHREITWSDWVILSRDPARFEEAHPDLAHQSGVVFLTGDVRDFAPPSGEVSAIVHAAAALDPSSSENEVVSTTVDGTSHVVEMARACRCRKVLYTSSGAVYGLRESWSCENSRCEPITPYGRAKLAAEQLLLRSGLDVRIARCFAFVGKHLDRTVHYAIGNFIRDALSGQDIVINGNGSPMRSYLYADDLVEWLFAILDRGESGRVYNVGSDEAISIRDLATLVRDTLGAQSGVKTLGKAVSGAGNCYVPNVDRIKRELGVRIRTSLDEAIRNSVGKAS